MIYLHELLPENISDEAAYHLVTFFSELALELEAYYFTQMRRHLDSVSSVPENFIPTKLYDDIPF